MSTGLTEHAKVSAAVARDMFSKPMHYVLSEDGILSTEQSNSPEKIFAKLSQLYAIIADRYNQLAQLDYTEDFTQKMLNLMEEIEATMLALHKFRQYSMKEALRVINQNQQETRNKEQKLPE